MANQGRIPMVAAGAASLLLYACNGEVTVDCETGTWDGQACVEPNPGSTCPPPDMAPTSVATGQAFPSSVKVEGDSLFWSNMVQDSTAAVDSGTVMKAALDGEDLTKLAEGQQQPVDLLISGGKVYWVTLHGGVASVPVGGGDVEMLYDDPDAEYSAIAVDDEAQLFFTSTFPATLGRLELGNGNVETVAIKDGIAWDVVVDESNVYMSASPGYIWAASKQDLEPWLFYENPDGLNMSNLVQADGYVYWSMSADCEPYQILRAPKAGGEPEKVADGGTCGTRMTTDGTMLYWTEPWSGRVMKAPLAGGDAVAIACNEDGPVGIAVDGTHVYWTTGPGGAIRKAPK